MENLDSLQVTMRADGFYPQALRWQGRTVRVLSVERVRTCGLERRYHVITPEGRYELGLHVGIGAWHVRHSPGWLSRLWARVQRTPRYALPAGRRRTRSRPLAQQPWGGQPLRGGARAIRLALVRQ